MKVYVVIMGSSDEFDGVHQDVYGVYSSLEIANDKVPLLISSQSHLPQDNKDAQWVQYDIYNWNYGHTEYFVRIEEMVLDSEQNKL